MKRRFLLIGFLFLAFVSVFAGFFLVEKTVNLTGKATFDSSILNVDIIGDSFEYNENLNVGCFVSGGESIGSDLKYRYFWEKNGEKLFIEDKISGVYPVINSTFGNTKILVTYNDAIVLFEDTVYSTVDNSSELLFYFFDNNLEYIRYGTLGDYGEQDSFAISSFEDLILVSTLANSGVTVYVFDSNFEMINHLKVNSGVEITKINEMEISKDGDIYVFGNNVSGGEEDFVLSKINSSGNFSWNYFYGNGSSLNEEAYDLVFDSNSDIYVLGGVRSSENDEVKFILKLDSEGNLIFEKKYVENSVGYGELEIDIEDNLYFLNENFERNNSTLVKVNSTGEIVFVKSISDLFPSNFTSPKYYLKDFKINERNILEILFSVNESSFESSLFLEMDLNGSLLDYSINENYSLGDSRAYIDNGRIISSSFYEEENDINEIDIYYNYFISNNGNPAYFSNITSDLVSIGDNLFCKSYAYDVFLDVQTGIFFDNVTIKEKEIIDDSGGSGSSRSGGGSVVPSVPEIPEEPSIPVVEDSNYKENPPLLIDLNNSFSEVNLVSKSEMEKEEEIEYSFSDLFDNAFDRFFYAKQISDCEDKNYEWNGKLNVCLNPNIRVTSHIFSAIKKVVSSLDLSRKDFFVVDSVLLYRCEGCFELSCEYNFERKVFRMFNWNIEEIDKCIPIACTDESRQCGEINDGCGNILNCGECDNSFDCFSGRCVPLDFDYCDDSDLGESFNSFGIVRDKYSINKDYCLDDKVLVEGVCKDSEYDFVEYECLDGCKDGVCMGDSCVDSDLENNIFVKGVLDSKGNVYEDECSSDVLIQYDCSLDAKVKSINTKCIFGCSNGTCIKGSCLDVDGNNSGIKSYVVDNNGRIEDYCSNDITLVEGGCSQNYLGQGDEYSSEMIFCPNGCKDGKCIPVSKNCEDDDGINFYYQGTINFKDPNGIMRSRKDTCTNTTAYIGLSVGSGKYVNEFDCPPEKQNIFPYYGGTIYECPNGCMNGKCLPPKEEVSYCSENYCKLYEGEYLVFDDYLALSTDYIYTNDYLIINYDYNYSYPAKTSLKLMLGDGFNLKSGELYEGTDYIYDFSNNDYYEMSFNILNIVGVRDSETIYDTVSKPYIEISFSLDRTPLIERSVSKPILKSNF